MCDQQPRLGGGNQRGTLERTTPCPLQVQRRVRNIPMLLEEATQDANPVRASLRL